MKGNEAGAEQKREEGAAEHATNWLQAATPHLPGAAQKGQGKNWD